MIANLKVWLWALIAFISVGAIGYAKLQESKRKRAEDRVKRSARDLEMAKRHQEAVEKAIEHHQLAEDKGNQFVQDKNQEAINDEKNDKRGHLSHRVNEWD
ncbi:MAG: hypothetical protein OQJ80_09950 [Kangiella sp.]|nr:hypothetical protein [Kangiella sp.]